MAVNGSLVLVTIGAQQITGETTNSLSLIRDAIETTHKMSPERAKTYIAGEKGATFSVSGMLDPTNVVDYGWSTAYAAYNAATVVTFRIGGIVAGDKYITGSAFITSLTLDNPQNDRSTFSMDLQVTGPTEELTTGT
jgi:predicted secreted protein